jgi:hypothetical protein
MKGYAMFRKRNKPIARTNVTTTYTGYRVIYKNEEYFLRWQFQDEVDLETLDHKWVISTNRHEVFEKEKP